MLSWLRDTLFRLLPHATSRGLRALGHPDATSPVLVTGNFTLTVQRLERVLEGRDVWLLVANSRGINVWCAAGGGHFTHHDIIAAIRVARLADHVDHRVVVLPQLAATGVEPAKIEAATGFVGRWGPARLEDLPAFLDRGAKVTQAQRRMTFPLWERMEMAIMWSAPMALAAFAAASLAAGLAIGGLAAATVAVQVFAIFALLPHLRLAGNWRWWTYGLSAIAGGALAVGAAAALGLANLPAMITLAAVSVAGMAILSIDLAGTTPWYPGTINSFHNEFEVELVEDRCTGAATCVQVCPCDVLRMNGKRRKVELLHPDACIRCGACIVQCPDDALRFRFEDGRVVEPATVRATRLNMIGRRETLAEPNVSVQAPQSRT